MLLKHYLDRGVSKVELSRRFGVNRRTIHNWVDTGQLDRDLAAGARGYSPRPPVAHKLAPYKAIIDARLEAFPKLSAKQLFDEVRAAGYPGCYSRVNDYVRATRPREPVESQGPGRLGTLRQGEDRARGAPVDGLRDGSQLLARIFLRFYLNAAMSNFLRGHIDAFEAWQGVPRELWYDNLKSVVLERRGDAVGDDILKMALFARISGHMLIPRLR